VKRREKKEQERMTRPPKERRGEARKTKEGRKSTGPSHSRAAREGGGEERKRGKRLVRGGV